jgi:hypothetical protein
MYIEVRGQRDTAHAVLHEPDDCKRFKVVVDASLSLAALSAALSGIGRLEGRDTVWVHPDAIRRLAAGRVHEGWEAAFDRMIGYARTKGWLDETTGDIRAHCEVTAFTKSGSDPGV